MIRSDGAPATCVVIQVILVSTDDQHARVVEADLSLTSAPFRMERMRPAERLASRLEARINLSGTPQPTLVILDFETLRDRCEDVASRILALRGRCAVECLVTRSESDPAAAARLRERGAFVADSVTQPDIGQGHLRTTGHRSRGASAQVFDWLPVGWPGPRTH